MAAPSSVQPNTPPLPWQVRQLPYILKLLLIFVTALLMVVLLITGILLLFLVPQSIIKGPGPNDTMVSFLTPFLIIALLFGGSLFGLIKLYPVVSAPTSFKPSYGSISADMPQHPFEVRYRQRGWRRSLSRKGIMRFDAETLLIEGYLTPSPFLQIGIIAALTVIPLVLFGVGLGIIPALIIAYYVGRKKIALDIPYYEIRDLSVTGCRLIFQLPDTQPAKVDLHTSTQDGERLYRELQLRFPAALGGQVGVS